uniref:RNA cytidine acetyltransferase n=1 Tax=Amphimedon queenslandica TaxID=400682 RepID=A0A1X7UL77_AMPQE
MPRKKVDNRIKTLIENGVESGHRSLFLILGEKGRDQVVLLHHMLSKASIKSRPSVLWCYKKELGFSTHRKKRMKQMKKKLKSSGSAEGSDENPFDLFISSTSIRYCYYSDTHRILGNTYGMCVLQDFEAITPNLLARTVETVEGGGAIVILLQNMTSLKQLYTMTMDVHSRYRTEAHQHVVGRFNERFILSLADTKCCLVIDDQLNVIPLSSAMKTIEPLQHKSKDESLSSQQVELQSLKESLQDTQPVGSLLSSAKTLDQGKAVLKCIEAISEKTLSSTVAITASRGRGKSAALGLAIAGAVAFSYSNIFVTSPSPENLKTLFEFVLKGFDALGYQEHEDYTVIQSTNPEFNKAVIRINVYTQHRQTIQYISPSDSHKLEQAELVCIDEAAAIPLPLVKNLLGPYLVFMASTVNGYEGTGRSLSLKLIEQLRRQSVVGGGASGRVLHEVSLSEPIRYSSGDHVEQWLHKVLCLDAANISRIITGCPPPKDCQLYYVNRDTLFSYHKSSEVFLHQMMSLYVSSHYKNTPNDLQLLSDAPAHHMFVLLPPVTDQQTTLPDILCVIQVCLEGQISKGSIMSGLSQGKRASGDLIPWTLSQQFVDHDFPSLSGVRIVRIATHPDVIGMGYGSQALQLLVNYYEGKFPNLEEDTNEMDTSKPIEKDDVIVPRSNLPPLLTKLSERVPESLDYVGVSYGLTPQLLKFWKRAGFCPVYLRQTPNDLTGEHSCIMIRTLDTDSDWLYQYHKDFCNRFLYLLSFQFSEFPASLALSLLQAKGLELCHLSHDQLMTHFNNYDLKRLDLYSRNMADYHLVTDLIPKLSLLYFTNKVSFSLSLIQKSILIRIGLQHKRIETLESELQLPISQLMALFNRCIRKFVSSFNSIKEEVIAKELPPSLAPPPETRPLKEGLEAELTKAADSVSKELKMKNSDLSEFAIDADDGWTDALSSGKDMNIVSVARSKRRVSAVDEDSNDKKIKKFKKQKKGKHN